jgi:hypothetical protein
LLDHAPGIRINQHLIESLISPDTDVLFDIIGIDDSAVPQNDLLLPLEESGFVPGRHFGISFAVANVPGDVIPLFDLAIDVVGREIAQGDVVQQTHRVIGLHMFQNHQRLSGQPDIDQRFLKARPEAADRSQDQVMAAVLDGSGHGLVKAFGSVAPATRPHSDRHARHGWNEL